MFHGLGALSLILCIITVVFYIRSHWVTDSAFVWGKPYSRNVDEGCTVKIASSQGSVVVCQEYTAWLTLPRNGDLSWVDPDQSRSFGFPGFRFEKSWYSSSFLEHPGKDDGITRTVSISDWLLMPVAALLPVVCILHWLKLGRFAPDCCQNCGYDLRATSFRCPECGKTFEKI